MIPSKNASTKSSVPLTGLDLYYSARPECAGDYCHITGRENAYHYGADTMHQNADARWTSFGCEDLVKKWGEWSGGAHCPVYKWEMVDTLQALVNSVEKHCGDHSYVRVLRLKGHGNGGSGFWIVKDVIDTDHLTEGSPAMKNLDRLKRFLIPSLSLILLEHCKAGRAENVLKKISKTLNGVAIMASKEDQISNLGRPKLEKIDTDKSGKQTKVKFVVCNSATCVTVDPLEPKDLAVYLMKKAKVKAGELAPSYIHPAGTPVASGFVDVPSQEATQIVEQGY